MCYPFSFFLSIEESLVIIAHARGLYTEEIENYMDYTIDCLFMGPIYLVIMLLFLLIFL